MNVGAWGGVSISRDSWSWRGGEKPGGLGYAGQAGRGHAGPWRKVHRKSKPGERVLQGKPRAAGIWDPNQKGEKEGETVGESHGVTGRGGNRRGTEKKTRQTHAFWL